jgi:hypothetical protein
VLNAGRRSRGGWRNALLSALWPGGAALREWAREINHKVVNFARSTTVLASDLGYDQVRDVEAKIIGIAMTWDHRNLLSNMHCHTGGNDH